MSFACSNKAYGARGRIVQPAEIQAQDVRHRRSDRDAQLRDLDERDCAACHGDGSTEMAPACNACHTEVLDQLVRRSGFHGTLDEALASEDPSMISFFHRKADDAGSNRRSLLDSLGGAR